METMVLRIFQQEVRNQCKFALMAVEDIKNALQVEDINRIWYSIQAFLVAAGNISKLIWPPNEKNAERSVKLRASLYVSNDSPIKPRLIRNHFEHFDERLDQWAKSSNRLNFIDSNIAPSNMNISVEPGDHLRNFDPTNYTLTFRGEIYHLQPIIDAIQKLWIRVESVADRPYW